MFEGLFSLPICPCKRQACLLHVSFEECTCHVYAEDEHTHMALLHLCCKQLQQLLLQKANASVNPVMEEITDQQTTNRPLMQHRLRQLSCWLLVAC